MQPEPEATTDEALVDAELETMTKAFAFLVPPELLEQLREDVRLFALTHPGMEPMVKRVLPPPVVDASGARGKQPPVANKKASGEGE